jgi:glucose-6-phosphate isomerase, archaeal
MQHRMLFDMADAVYDWEWLKTASNRPVYTMHRAAFRTAADASAAKNKGLRYDITIVPPAMLGEEYAKTKGHYHAKTPGMMISYPEMYQVLEGSAVYLMQKIESGAVSDAVAVRAKKGDIVIIPPDYGHVTINPGHETLKMANWVSSEFDSSYGDMRQKEGLPTCFSSAENS